MHQAQITQKRWEYDLTTNSVKFMQLPTAVHLPDKLFEN